MHACTRRLCGGALLLIWLAPMAASAAAPWSGEASVSYDSNVANVKRGGDERADGFAELALARDQALYASAGSALFAQLRLDAQSWFEYEGLSRLEPSLRLRWLWRPGRGFYAPIVGITASAAWQEFDSALRDAAEYRGGFFMQQQLTTRIAWRLAWWTRARRAEHDAVFSDATRAASVDVDWQLARRVVLYAGYQHRDGELVSTAPNPAAGVLAAARAQAPDDVFRGETAFRVPGEADLWTAGANYSFSPRLSFDLTGREVGAAADNGAHYRRTQLFASLLWRY